MIAQLQNARMHACMITITNQRNSILILTCHDFPTLTVTKVSFPRRCTENGTSSMM